MQCGAGTCCALSLWLRGLRMCTPLGRVGEECHPGSHKVLRRHGCDFSDPDLSNTFRVLGTPSLLFGESLGCSGGH